MTAVLEATALALPGRLRPTGLSLAPGTLTALIGPNGGGKTSLLHAIARIGRPRGQVAVGGIPLDGLHPHARQRLVGYLSAARELRWPLSAADLLGLGQGPGTDFSVAVAALGLQSLLDRRIDRLSTGERSRLLIARVLAARPRLLLLDEPAASLDPLWQLRLMEHLRDIVRDDGGAALVAMHDLDMAAAYADRLIVMEGGRIVAEGGPDLIEGPVVGEVFGIARRGGRWRPV